MYKPRTDSDPAARARAIETGKITCSDCGTAMSLDRLAQHKCQKDSYFRAVQPASTTTSARAAPTQNMRIDTSSFKHDNFLAPQSAYHGPRHSPSSAGSRPSSPGEDLSRSYSSASSASSSARSLPFLEKYKAMVSPNMLSSTIAAPKSMSSSAPGTGGRSPIAPSPRDNNHFASRVVPSPADSSSSFSSSQSSANASTGWADRFNSRSTPATSVSSPTAAKLERNDDHRATLRPSPSVPIDLGPPRSAAVPATGLDACLGDLRLIAEGDAEDLGDAEEFDYLKDFIGTDQHELHTPRGPVRSAVSKNALPHSQSVPILGASRALADSVRDSPHCTRCRADLAKVELRKAGDGQPFCRPCYSYLYLPKCRKCSRPIEGGAVSSSDGKVSGKYHPECFACFECSAPFPNKEFYVFDSRPYCQLHYHALNGSLCAGSDCGKPIEGPCVNLVGEGEDEGGRYHPACFTCSHGYCRLPLLEHHWLVLGKPYCERHAVYHDTMNAAKDQTRSRQQLMARKRQTIITRR